MVKKSEIIEWCDRIIVFSFYGLIYFLPISTALVEICSTFIITTFFVKRGVGHPLKPVSTHLNKALGLFIFINFLSVVFSQYPALSIKGFIFKLFQGVVLLSSFVECMKTKKEIKIFVTVYLVSAALVIVNGLAQYFQGRGFVHGHLRDEGRILSSLNHANDFGAYLIVVVAFLLSFIVLWGIRLVRRSYSGESDRVPSCPVFVKAGLFILFLAALACLGLTFSRGAWVGFFGALIFMGIQQKKTIYIPVLIGVLFVAVFFPKLVATRNVSFSSDRVRVEKQAPVNSSEKSKAEQEEITMSVLSRIAGMPEGKLLKPFKGFTGQSRKGWWEEALSIIREFPVLGAGLNTYSRVAPKYQIFWAGGGYPHNCYLQMAAETGLLGLGSFLWVLFVLFRHAIRSLKKMKDQYLSAVLLGMLSGLAGYLVHSFFDTNFYSVQIGNLMWVIMGLIVAVQNNFPCTEEHS